MNLIDGKNQRVEGAVLETKDGRRYERQKDGSLRVMNKPRSRVKRLREERRQSRRAA